MVCRRPARALLGNDRLRSCGLAGVTRHRGNAGVETAGQGTVGRHARPEPRHGQGASSAERAMARPWGGASRGQPCGNGADTPFPALLMGST
jgi:hypothetical protein